VSLDAATVLLQWAVGGMVFCWITTRHREVGLGYGWLLRGTYATFAGIAVAAGVVLGTHPVQQASAVAFVVAALAALALSVARRRAGVSGQRREQYRRSERVAAMTGIEREVPTLVAERAGKEFDPRWDLVAPALGLVGLVVAGLDAGSQPALAVARFLAGAAFLGAVSDAMLLGHWYLVQPGLPRRHLVELVRWTGWTWVPEVALLLVPIGMVSAITGDIDDGWNGLLVWFWMACAVTTIVLVGVTRAALKERQYSAVMAATGLLYLAILTAFGTDLVARMILAA
jgi:uncharacterized membrane protein YhdT